jgi:hypothetical protein
VSRKIVFWLVAFAAVILTAIAAAPASADVIIPVGPHQYFSGVVNGHTAQATIRMACFGPIRPGQTGHPFTGQTVEAVLDPVPTARDVGFTGSAADAIDVHFPTPVPTLPVVLRAYQVPAAIPDVSDSVSGRVYELCW